MDHLKYGFITIIYNHSVYDKLYKFFFDKEETTEDSIIILLFDDDIDKIVIELSDVIKTDSIILSPDINSDTPFMIEKNGILHVKDKEKALKAYPIFQSYITKDDYDKNCDASVYNCKYYKIDSNNDKQYTFSILKKKYGSDSSRYLFAYDPKEFTKNEIQYIIYGIFR